MTNIVKTEQLTIADLHRPEIFTHISTLFENYIEKNKLFSMIGSGNRKKKHINVEGWMFLANFFGITTVVRSCERRTYEKPGPDGESIQLIRYHATVDAVELSTGKVINTATLSAGNDESKHKYSAEYVLESLSQTRATGKVLRLIFGFLASAHGFQATPTEEMTEFTDKSEVQTQLDDLEKKYNSLKSRSLAMFSEFKSLAITVLSNCKTPNEVHGLSSLVSTLKNDSETTTAFNERFTELKNELQDATPVVPDEQQQQLETEIENNKKEN